METFEQQAVIDRIEDATWAVLLVGDDEEEYVIPVEQLPAGAGEGSWLRVRIEQGNITEITVDAEATAATRRRIQPKQDALRQRKRHFRPIASDEGDVGSDPPHAEDAEADAPTE